MGAKRGGWASKEAQSAGSTLSPLNELIMALSRPAVARRSQRGRGGAGAGGADTVAALRLQGAGSQGDLVSKDIRVLSEGPQSYFLSLGLGLCGALVR